MTDPIASRRNIDMVELATVGGATGWNNFVRGAVDVTSIMGRYSQNGAALGGVAGTVGGAVVGGVTAGPSGAVAGAWAGGKSGVMAGTIGGALGGLGVGLARQAGLSWHLTR